MQTPLLLLALLELLAPGRPQFTHSALTESQSSGAVITPSPQDGAAHFTVQPSSLLQFMSSQVSPGSTVPLPQVLGTPGKSWQLAIPPVPELLLVPPPAPPVPWEQVHALYEPSAWHVCTPVSVPLHVHLCVEFFTHPVVLLVPVP
jgi:hypothetical protein